MMEVVTTERMVHNVHTFVKYLTVYFSKKKKSKWSLCFHQWYKLIIQPINNYMN